MNVEVDEGELLGRVVDLPHHVDVAREGEDRGHAIAAGDAEAFIATEGLPLRGVVGSQIERVSDAGIAAGSLRAVI